MAFTVETGDIVANANSYMTLEEFEEHHTDRGIVVEDGTYSVLLKQAALINATDYVDKRFGPVFRGSRQASGQSLEWPRLGAQDDDGYSLSDIPTQLKKAVAEYALVHLQLGELMPLPARPFPSISRVDGSVSGGQSGPVTVDRVKADDVETETRYSAPGTRMAIDQPGAASSSVSAARSLPEYPVADEWLRPIIKGGFTGVSLVRA